MQPIFFRDALSSATKTNKARGRSPSRPLATFVPKSTLELEGSERGNMIGGSAYPPTCTSISKQGGVGIIIPDQGPVGWLGPQAVKKKLEPQKFQLKSSIDGLACG